jgi:hypothetical protein
MSFKKMKKRRRIRKGQVAEKLGRGFREPSAQQKKHITHSAESIA